MRTIRFRRLWLIPCAWVLYSCLGCHVGPNYTSTSVAIPDAWHQQLENGEFVGTSELDQWWTLLDDDVLNELIGSADSSSLTLQGAYFRICQARAQRCIVASSKFPQLSTDGSFLTSLQSANAFGGGGGFASIFTRDLWTLQGNIAWEPDLFGRIYRQIESADATICAQVEAYRDVLVSLYGDIAQTYVQVRTTQAQLEYARQNVGIQQKALDLARRRVEGGVAANVDEFQAESNLASTEAEIPPLEQQLHQSLNRLAVLLGHCPGSLHDPLALPAPIPSVPDYLPLVIPCDAIRQRPDIRNAERLVAARTADIGVATAELFPRFSIGGNIGLSSQNFSSLMSSASLGYGLGPSFSWPVFQAGRIRCNIRNAESIVQESIANYEQTVLLALEEVENAVVGFNKERVRRKALARTVEAAENSLESVLALYREGKVDFQNVLDTQRTLFLAQNGLAISEGQIVIQLITLYRAMGGGWKSSKSPTLYCAHAVCPPRGDPRVVENFPTKDSSQRSLDLGSAIRDPAEDPQNNDEEPDDDIDEEPEDDSDDDDDKLPRPTLDTKRESREEPLDKLLKELEERLETKPDSGTESDSE